MRLSTPDSISRFFYLGFNTKARDNDELIGFSISRFYVGVYPQKHSIDISIGILNSNGALE